MGNTKQIVILSSLLVYKYTMMSLGRHMIGRDLLHTVISMYKLNLSSTGLILQCFSNTTFNSSIKLPKFSL